jgi:hypothetical protein
MDKETLEIDLTNLCYYDKRNPDCSVDDEDIEDHKKGLLKKNKTCSCDNCFYGRTKLTEQLIWQQERMYSEEDMSKAYFQGWATRERYDDMVPDIIYPKDLDYEEQQDYAFNLWFEQFKKK